MLGVYVSIAIFVLCINVGKCGYCDQHTIPFQGVTKNYTRFYLNGESFTIICDPGYKVAIPNSKFTCRNGFWKGHFPPCIPNDCATAPPSIEHGRVKSYAGTHLSTVEYECDEHYHPRSDYKVQCSYGIWAGQKPVCLDSRCYTNDLKLKEGLSSLTPNTTFSGERLNVSCDHGYHFKGMEPICVRGSWTEYGASPCKEDDCFTFSLENGSLLEPKEKKVWRWDTFKRERTEVLKKVVGGHQKTPGTVLYVACDHGRQFQGTQSGSTVTCSKGKWTPNPVCQYA
ncbi:hypothetical protein JTE90_012522 [Oedothorax gibbosus]|uniref:Sushi domain-containing protein n=1 Tax=Oedothorax gibbosus TaxID=931172 RepID=A0AAV6V1J2_9ARAC|nr:hypothetical protein JTE90_012522 [Oedothorax gibbosus]